MGRKLSEHEAVILLAEFSMRPKVVYPGSSKPWPAVCLNCGKDISPRLVDLRRGKVKGCRFCGPGNDARPNKVSENDAIASMINAGMKPLDPYKNSKSKWRCECMVCGEQIEATLNGVRTGRNGCKFCANQFVSEKDAVESMLGRGFQPLEPYRNSTSPWLCRCLDCGHESRPRFHNRNASQGCGYCAKNRVDPDDAVAVMLAAGLQPLENYNKSGIGWRCKCLSCGREVAPHYTMVKNNRTGCAFCSGRRVDPLEAEVAMRKAGLLPTGPYPGANSIWPCHCSTCDRPVKVKYSYVRAGKGECPHCTGRIFDVAQANQRMSAANLLPLEPYPGADKPWRCKCLGCGGEVTPRYSGIRAGQGGCLRCGNDSSAKTRTRGDDGPRAIMIEHGLDPLEPYPGSKTSWLCKCLKCGRNVTPIFNSVQAGQGGCAYCSGNRVDPAEAYLLMIQSGIRPLEPYSRSSARWKCECMACGRKIQPTYSNVRNGSRCVNCTEYGFKTDQPAGFYAVTDGIIIKCGISNGMKARLRTHSKQGLTTVLAIINFDTGFEALELERSWMAYVKYRLADPSMKVNKSRLTDGHTEALMSDANVVQFIKRLVKHHS